MGAPHDSEQRVNAGSRSVGKVKAERSVERYWMTFFIDNRSDPSHRNSGVRPPLGAFTTSHGTYHASSSGEIS
jgi:hypothetical protein